MGRVALVTGSSRGLGAAIARRLAADGMAVAVNGVAEEETEAIAAQLRDSGALAKAFVADITDCDSVVVLAREIAQTLGPVEVLIVNATGPQPEAPIAEVDWAVHRAQLDFFLRSPVQLGAALLPSMTKRGWGRIVHIDSEVADRPPSGRSAYAAAKHAQIGLAKAWAVELAPHGITVNSVAPGFVPVERHVDVPDVDCATYIAGVPVGRIGTPSDIAHVVSFLSSEGAGFITGQRIVVDGGRSLA